MENYGKLPKLLAIHLSTQSFLLMTKHAFSQVGKQQGSSGKDQR